MAPKQPQLPLQRPETPRKTWSRVSADVMSFQNNQYLVTVDNLSGYFEVDRLTVQTAKEVIIKLRMIFARFRAPDVLLTDNGPQFTSAQFADFAERWRFTHETSSSHHPRSNGQAEAAVKTAKSIMKKAREAGTDVYMALPDYRNTPHSATGLAPVSVLLGHNTRTAMLPMPRAPPTQRTRHQQQDKDCTRPTCQGATTAQSR